MYNLPPVFNSFKTPTLNNQTQTAVPIQETIKAPASSDSFTKSGLSFGSKVAIGLGATALIAGSIYLIKSGKGKSIIDNIKGHFNRQEEIITRQADELNGINIEQEALEQAQTFIDETKSLIKEGRKIAEDVKSEAMSAIEEAKAKADDVIELFKAGGKRNSVQVASIRQNGLVDIMEEFKDDGQTLVRKSTFREGMPASIEEFLEGNKKNIMHFDTEGNIQEYRKGFVQFDNDSWRYDARLLFRKQDDSITKITYCKGEYFTDKLFKEDTYAELTDIDKVIKMNHCETGREFFADNTSKTKASIHLDASEKLNSYSKNIEGFGKGSTEEALVEFVTDNTIFYSKGTEYPVIKNVPVVSKLRYLDDDNINICQYIINDATGEITAEFNPEGAVENYIRYGQRLIES